MSVPKSEEKLRYPLRVLSGVGLVAVLSLAASLEYYQTTTLSDRSSGDPYAVETQVQRLREAAALIPRGVVVGYVSDVPFDQVRGSAAFFGAQYALAPRLLVELPAREATDWVLGNFSKPADVVALEQRHQLKVVRDLGGGVLILRRNTR
jgi:hypothetical protein